MTTASSKVKGSLFGGAIGDALGDAPSVEDTSGQEPTIEVTASEELPLLPGRHQFQLVVEDDAGNRSDPDLVEVVVRDTLKPTAVLEAPKTVQPGQTFSLDGRRAVSEGDGQIATAQSHCVGHLRQPVR